MPTDRTARLIAEASNPATPADRLRKIANTESDARVQRAIKRNPGLPEVWYLSLLAAGDEDAWCNPQFGLVYLAAPTEGAAVKGALALVRNPVRDAANIHELRQNVGPVLESWWATTGAGFDMARYLGSLVRTPSHHHNTEAPRRMVEAGAAMVREALPRAGGWRSTMERDLALVDRWVRGEAVDMARLEQSIETTMGVVTDRHEQLVVKALLVVVEGATSESPNAASNAALNLLACEEGVGGNPSALNARFAQILRQHFPRCPVPMWLESA